MPSESDIIHHIYHLYLGKTGVLTTRHFKNDKYVEEYHRGVVTSVHGDSIIIRVPSGHHHCSHITDFQLLDF